MERSILLVDDNAQARTISKTRLSMQGYKVDEAEGGIEALKKLKEAKFDLIILDLMMPVIDGFKVLQMIKTDPALMNIPVIVLSGRGQPEEVEKALKLGASDFLVKMRTNPNILLEKVRQVIEKGEGPKAVPHYLLALKENVHDAVRLSTDFRLPSGYHCLKCGGPLLLELLPDYSHQEPWFTGHFVCLTCR